MNADQLLQIREIRRWHASTENVVGKPDAAKAHPTLAIDGHAHVGTLLAILNTEAEEEAAQRNAEVVAAAGADPVLEHTDGGGDPVADELDDGAED